MMGAFRPTPGGKLDWKFCHTLEAAMTFLVKTVESYLCLQSYATIKNQSLSPERMLISSM